MKRTIEELRTALGDNTGRYPAWVLLSRWTRYRTKAIETKDGTYYLGTLPDITVEEHNAALSSVTLEERALVIAHGEFMAAQRGVASAKEDLHCAKFVLAAAEDRLETARAEFEKLNES